MQIRALAVWLAGVSLAFAQAGKPAAARAASPEASADVARLAAMVLGRKGGNHLFYLPTRDEPATPAKWGFPYEDAHFRSADGTSLHGWFIPVRNGEAKGTVVFSHGNAGSAGHHLGFVLWLADAGYNVMIYDYRGFGRSGGTVDRRGMLQDVQAAFAYVRQRPDVDADRLVSLGHSLGGAKSVTALAEGHVEGLRAIIVDGAFASYQAMARVVAGQLGANLVTDEWAPKDHVARLPKVPFLVVHGTADEVVPFSQGRQLFEGAQEPKTLFEVKSGRHNDALSRDGGAYRRKLIEWLDEVMKG